MGMKTKVTYSVSLLQSENTCKEEKFQILAAITTDDYYLLVHDVM
jgi:hypothetical protein